MIHATCDFVPGDRIPAGEWQVTVWADGEAVATRGFSEGLNGEKFAQAREVAHALSEKINRAVAPPGALIEAARLAPKSQQEALARAKLLLEAWGYRVLARFDPDPVGAVAPAGASSEAADLYREGERIFDALCDRLGLDANDGDVESADAADWIAAAVEAKLARQFDDWTQFRVRAAAPRDATPQGLWAEVFDMNERQWFIWRDDGPTADCPKLGPFGSESVAIAVRDALNGLERSPTAGPPAP